MERREGERGREEYESGSIKNYSGGIFRQHLLAVTHILCPTDSSSTQLPHPPLTTICRDRVAYISGPTVMGLLWGLRLVQSRDSNRKRKKARWREKIYRRGDEPVSNTRDVVFWILERRERSNYRSRCRKWDTEKKDGQEGRKEDGERGEWRDGEDSDSPGQWVHLSTEYALVSLFPLSFPRFRQCCREMRFLPSYHGRHSFDMYTFLPLSTVLRLLDIDETYPATKDPHVTRWGLVFQACREHPPSLSSSPIISKKKMWKNALSLAQRMPF